MNEQDARVLLCLTAVLLLAPCHAAEKAHALRTADGFALSLAADGGVAGIQLDGRDLPLAASPALFHLRDAAAPNSVFVPAMGRVADAGNRLVLQLPSDPLELALTATIRARGNAFQIDGEVLARAPVERCIDLKIALPVDPAGFAFGTGLFDGPARNNRNRAKQKAAVPKSADPEIDAAEAEDNALYPLAPISHRGTGTGLTLAVPPTHPTRFLTGSDRTGVFIVLRLGISPATATPSRTPFRVIAYRHDAEWGFRSALARYYELYREEFFTRRVQRIGAWTTQRPSLLAHPHLYAYYEAGFAAWRHPAGTDSGVNVKLTLEHLDEGPAAQTLADYERLCELPLARKLGLYALPYTIVGQRQLLQLPALPENYADAIRTLDAWQPKQSIPFDGPPQAGSFRSAEEHKEIIRNSTLHDPQGSLAFMPRPYRGPTLTFPQNPSPNLFRGEGRPTVASYTLDYYIPRMLESKFVDGIYLDSLGRWCGYHNYRKEHFHAATVPLTYSGTPARVSLWNLQSHAEYMWEARKRLHAQGKILMANGVHPTRVMLGFAADVLGREGAPAMSTGEEFYAPRVAAGAKPYCLLNAHHRTSPALWNTSLYLGYLTGCNDPKGLADEAKYLPAIIKCNEAGWEPVTHARAHPAVVGVERWGGQKADAPLFFTVMNRSAESVNATLTIELGALGRSGNPRAIAVPNAVAIETGRNGTQLTLRFPLGAEQATALEVRE